jgi:MFS transporter, SP family, arabinose:H+ symporter
MNHRAVDWLANYAPVVVCPNLRVGIGLAWIMVIFAALCTLGAGFVYRSEPSDRVVAQRGL